jgi:hypothetical protein
MPENEEHSRSYERLSQENKDKVDAILSFLVGMNTKEASSLINAADEELSYRSTVGT